MIIILAKLRSQVVFLRTWISIPDLAVREDRDENIGLFVKLPVRILQIQPFDPTFYFRPMALSILSRNPCIRGP
jgi:hypothetical protein